MEDYNKFLKDSFDVFFGEKQETEPHELKGVGPSFVFDCNEDQDFVNDVWQMPKPVVCQSTRKRKLIDSRISPRVSFNTCVYSSCLPYFHS